MIRRCPNCSTSRPINLFSVKMGEVLFEDRRFYFLPSLHTFQDSEYGKGKRVMNTCDGGDKARCTVCGYELPLK